MSKLYELLKKKSSMSKREYVGSSDLGCPLKSYFSKD